MEDEFYVYRHIRKDDGTVFYVGKGKGDRAWDIHGRNKYWKNIVNKHGYEIEIIEKGLKEERAFEKEIELIKSYKSSGECQTNLTDGGEGVSGYKKTPEQIKNQIQANKESWDKLNEEERKERCAKSGKMWKDPEFREIAINAIKKSRKKFFSDNPEWSAVYNTSEEEQKERTEKIRKAHIGRDHSWSDKISETVIKSRNNRPYRLECLTPDGIFKSVKKAAEHYKLARQTVTYRINSNLHRWKDWKLGKIEKTHSYKGELLWVTPLGKFRTLKDAIIQHPDLTDMTIRGRCYATNKPWKDWYREEESTGKIVGGMYKES